MPDYNVANGLTIDQILNSNGFTMDTSDFVNIDDVEDEPKDLAHFNSIEMLKNLNLEEDESQNEFGEISYLSSTFDEIRSKMYSIYDGVSKLIIKEGFGNVIPNDAQVTLKYVGYFEASDEPFDSTFYQKNKRSVFRLERGEMIYGLEIAVSSMKKHEKALFLIDSHLAYGKLGCPPRIPPDAEVLFKVELIDYLEKAYAIEYEELDDEEKKKFSVIEKIVDTLFNVAKDNFKKHKYKQAFREYSKAISHLEGATLINSDEQNKMTEIINRALLNLMVCCNKLNKPKLTCATFERLPIKSVKAHFHYAKALTTLGQHDEAMLILHKAIKLSPDCVDVKKLILEVEEYREKNLEFEKKFSRNSLKLSELNNINDFDEMVFEMCDDLIASTSLKEAIPAGLSSKEMQSFQKIAALRGLLITKETIREIDTYFLTKSYS